MRASRAGFVGLSVPWLTVCAAVSIPSDGIHEDNDAQDPPDLVISYFQTDDAAVRDGIAKAIDESFGGSIDRVAQAVRDARLWPSIPDRVGALSFKSKTGGNVRVDYQLPSGYESSIAWPVILIGSEGAPQSSLAHVSNQIGDFADGFILVCPHHWLGGSFDQSPAAAADFRQFVRFIRQSFHTDTDRLFLYGSGGGADSVWMTGIMHPDLFAGVVVFGSYPRVPYAEQLYPIILPNLANLPVLSVWNRPSPHGLSGRLNVVAAHNRAIVAFARRASLPIEGLELSIEASESIMPLRKTLRKFLSRTRQLDSNAVSRWFRYPGQGHVGWLRQTKFLGEIGRWDQLSILPGPTVDRDTFIANVIRNHLAHVRGHRDGNTFRLETRKCAVVTISVPLGLLDPSGAVTVYCNGKRRHAAAITPDVQVLLAHAYRTWDAQRLIVAEMSFSITQDRP